MFDSFMLRQSEYNLFLYFEIFENGTFIGYVDDMLVSRKSMSHVRILETRLDKTFQMKDWEEEIQILGIELQKEGDKCF